MPTGHSIDKERTTKAVAALIKAQMGYKDVSQADLARQTTISQPTLSRILKGAKVLDLDELIEICAALDVSYVSLLAEAEKASSNNGLAPVTQLRPKVSDATPSVVGRAAARRGKGNKKDDGLGED